MILVLLYFDYITDVLQQVCSNEGISIATSQTGLITSQAVKEQDQIPDEIIDITKVQIESISEYFTTEAFKVVMNKGL